MQHLCNNNTRAPLCQGFKSRNIYQTGSRLEYESYTLYMTRIEKNAAQYLQETRIERSKKEKISTGTMAGSYVHDCAGVLCRIR